MSTPHIHHDCIIVWAADPTLRVESYSGVHWSWLPISSMTPSWHPDSRYRVLDHGGNVLAETPPPKRMVRIPETVLPAPLTAIPDNAASYYVSFGGVTNCWRACISGSPNNVCESFALQRRLLFATEEDAQQWADFLNQKFEEVSE